MEKRYIKPESDLLTVNVASSLLAGTVINPGNGESYTFEESDDDDDWVGAKGHTFTNGWDED